MIRYGVDHHFCSSKYKGTFGQSLPLYVTHALTISLLHTQIESFARHIKHPSSVWILYIYLVSFFMKNPFTVSVFWLSHVFGYILSVSFWMLEAVENDLFENPVGFVRR